MKIGQLFVDVVPKLNQAGLKTLTSSLKVAAGAAAGVGAAGAGAFAAVAGGAAAAAGAVGALGIAFAAQSESVKKSFADLGSNFSKVMTDAAKPIVPVLNDIAGQLGSVLSDFAPVITNLMAQFAPILGGIGTALTDSLRLAIPAFQALAEAGMPIIKALGDGLVPLMKVLVPILTDLADVVGGAAQSLVGPFLAAIMAILPVFGDLLGALAEIGSTIIPILLPALGTLVSILGGAFMSILTSLSPVLDSFFSILGSVAVVIGGTLAQAIQALTPLLPVILTAFMSLVSAVLPLVPLIGDLVVAAAPLVVMFAGLASTLLTALVPALVPIVGWIGRLAEVILGGLVTAVTWVRDTAGPAIQAFLDAFRGAEGDDGPSGFFQRVADGIQAAWPIIQTRLAELGTALWQWIKDALPPALVQLQEYASAAATWLIDVGLPLLRGKLVEWGTALWTWIQDNVPTMLTAIAGFANSLASWLIDVGLPLLLDKLKTWGAAIWEWIGPRIPDLLGALGGFLGEAVGWLVGTGLPLLVGAMLKLAWELVKWVAPRIPDLLAALGGFLWSATNWVLTTGIPTLVGSMYNFGKEALLGFGRSITDSPLVSKIGEFFGRVGDSAKSFFIEKVSDIKRAIQSNLLDPINRVTKVFGVAPINLALGGEVFVGTGAQRGLATGGLLRGPGTGTSDSILGIGDNGIPTARVSNGEYVVNAKQTRKHLALLEALNAGQWDGLATGGLVDSWIQRGASFAANNVLDPVAGLMGRLFPSPEMINKSAVGSVNVMSKAIKDWVKKKEDEAAASNAATGAMGNGNGIGGWQWQMAVLRAQFPGLRLHSGYRPGAITATGNPSMHGRGRAVDVPPRMDVFNWIKANYGARTQELIFSPAGGGQVHRGKNHMYTGVTRSMHFDHVHWGYDKGGWLEPGMRATVNGTGQPEAVLTNPQWDKIERLVAAVEANQGSQSRSGPLIGTAVIRETVDADLIMARLEHRVRMARV